MENNKDVRQLVKDVQPDLAELSTSSILSETSALSLLSESDVVNKHKSFVAEIE